MVFWLIVFILSQTSVKGSPYAADRINEDDLPPFYLVPPLCGSRLRAWSRMHCSGAFSIKPGESVWVNAALISTQPRCWLECARLWFGEDQADAPNCKSRPDEGLDSITTLSEGLLGMFSQSMGPIIEALSELGYDPSRLHAATYDFRLTPQKLEERDGYFSKLKNSLEIETRRLNKRAILLAHSMGCKVVAYFFKWLEHDFASKKKAKTWIQSHIAVYYMNACPFLGAPDIATSLIVGEQNGMPISLKLIHEVLASSAGGILQLAPIPAWYLNQKNTGSSLQHMTADMAWLKLEDDNTFYGKEPCRGQNSSYAFFSKLAKLTNDSHSQETADLLKALCHDHYVGDIFDAVQRPPIDDIHVSYGVGLVTRISTTFGLGPMNSSQTLPYFYDALETEQAQKYQKFTRPFTVRGFIDESGLDARTLTDHHRQILHEKLPGRSGDDTVPYASLSAAHSWFRHDKVSVSAVPLRKKFLKEEVLTNLIYNASSRAAVLPQTISTLEDNTKKCNPPETCPQREPRLTIFEQIDKNRRLTIWELDSAQHRTSANHPVYLHHLQRLVANHILQTKKADSNAQQEDDISALLPPLSPGAASVASSLDFFQANDFLPTDDTECFWSFSKGSCAHPSICEYRYAVGDLSLSQSCRLKRTLSIISSPTSSSLQIDANTKEQSDIFRATSRDRHAIAAAQTHHNHLNENIEHPCLDHLQEDEARKTEVFIENDLPAVH